MKEIPCRWRWFDLEAAATKKRISAEQNDKRDLLIYFLWENGGLTNQEIGSYFGLTYSAVSRRVGEIGKRLKQEKELMDAFASLKLQIKVMTPFPSARHSGMCLAGIQKNYPSVIPAIL